MPVPVPAGGVIDIGWGAALTNLVNSLETTVGSQRRTVARKTADETVNNSAAYQDDDHLALQLDANVVYRANIHLLYQSSTVADFRYRFVAPAGASLAGWSFLGINSASAFVYAVANNGGVIGLGGTGADTVLDAWGLVVVGGTAGTLQVQWCQDVANASNTILRATSYLTLERIG